MGKRGGREREREKKREREREKERLQFTVTTLLCYKKLVTFYVITLPLRMHVIVTFLQVNEEFVRISEAYFVTKHNVDSTENMLRTTLMEPRIAGKQVDVEHEKVVIKCLKMVSVACTYRVFWREYYYFWQFGEFLTNFKILQ